MSQLYKRYIPPKPTEQRPFAATPTAKLPAASSPEHVPPKRKRERTEEEVAERKAKKLRKKGIDPATIPHEQSPPTKRTSPLRQTSSKVLPVEGEEPTTESRGEFADVRSSKKRHKLEKEAREARRLAKKAENETASGKVTNEIQTGLEVSAIPVSLSKEGTQNVVENDRQELPSDVRKEEQQDYGDVEVNGGGEATSLARADESTTKNKKTKREKGENASKVVAASAEVEKISPSEKGPEKQVASQPKKRRHKLESVLQEPFDGKQDGGDRGDQGNMMKHSSILKKFHKSSELSQDMPRPDEGMDKEDQNRGKPIILDLAPLPQPEKVPTPEFIPDAAAIPAWIAKPTVIANTDTAPFSDLNIDQKISEYLSNQGFSTALPIQKALIPLLFPPGSAGARYLPGTENMVPDLAVSAPTGSGKTIAYLLPILEALKTVSDMGKLKVLIVVPTRELVTQVAGVAEKLVRGPGMKPDGKAGIKVGVATGNGSFKDEQARLITKSRLYDPKAYRELFATAHRWNYPPKQDSPDFDDFVSELEEADDKEQQRVADTVAGIVDHVPVYESAVDILVATPGRLIEHIKSTLGFTLKHLQWLVLDEADKLLDLQYHGVLETVNAELERPRREDEQDAREKYLRQRGNWDDRREGRRVRKVVLSATMTRDISKLVELKLRRPQMVVVRGSGDDAIMEESGAAAAVKGENAFELPVGLREYCMSVGDGSEKPLVLVEVLRTRILPMAWGKQKSNDDEEDSMNDDDAQSDNTSSEDEDDDTTSPESDSDSSSSEEDEESEENAQDLLENNNNTAYTSTNVNEPEEPAMHPSRLAFLSLSSDRKTIPTVLIFTSSTEAANRLSHVLKCLVPAWAPWIGTMTRSDPKKRTALSHTDLKKPLITIATDRAARGLDTLGGRPITHVVQYDVPRSVEGYVHRVGRTARVERLGEAWTLFGDREARWFVKTVVRGKEIKRRRDVERVKMRIEDDGLRERFDEVVRGMRQEVVFGNDKEKERKEKQGKKE